jgi:tetratricopeptide (TPR) repeat protein
MVISMDIDFTSVDAFVNSNNFVEAELACLQLVESYPNNYRVFSKLAYVLALARRTNDAIDAVRKAIELDAEQPMLWWKLGTYYLNSESLQDAVTAFTETIRLSETYSDPYYLQVAYFLRAEAFSRSGEYSSAENDLRNVENDMFIWLDRPISKKAIIENCKKRYQ